MSADAIRVVEGVLLAALVANAGFLIAVRRRSRRAAVLGLAGLGLCALWLVHLAAGSVDAWFALAVFGKEGQAAAVMHAWTNGVHHALAYALLIGAVLVDRPPPTDE